MFLSVKVMKESWKDEDSADIQNIAKSLIELNKEDTANEMMDLINNSDFIKDLGFFYQGCKSFSNLLQEEINAGNTTLKKLKKENNNEIIIKQGTALIFQLRKFLTGQSLQFVLAGQTKDGTLKESTYSQEEVFGGNFSKIRVSFNNGQIELASAIERLKSLGDVGEGMAKQWSDLVRYGLVENYNTESSIIATEDKRGGKDNRMQTYEIYEKNIPDINVYFRWVTSNKKRTLAYYYDVNEVGVTGLSSLKGLLAYDRGWLYQWLKIAGEVEVYSEQTPLLAFMRGEGSFRENIAGIKGGDKGLEQYKFRNRRVITLRNMYDILNGGNGYNGILNAIESFITAKDSETQKRALVNLYLDFTTYNKEEIESFVEKRFDEIKKMLQR